MAEQHKHGGHEQPMTERQKKGYDEAARGGPGVPPSDVGIPPNPGDDTGRTVDDYEAREAANDVRRQDKSAD